MGRRRRKSDHPPFGSLARYNKGCRCSLCITVHAKFNGLDWCTEVDGILECGVGMKVLCRVSVLDLAERMIMEGTLAASIYKLNAQADLEEAS